MALNAYLTLKGQKQGAIQGSVTQKGREGTIAVHSISHEVIKPSDPVTGLPTGKRMHKPFTILKEVDRSSPQLWSALCTNEVISSWTLQFWAAAPATGTVVGTEKQIYTIILVNASISSIHEFMEDNELPANATLPLMEEVTFTYQKIEWLWVDGGVMTSDDWSAPVA
jgi:type VI secretion system secreted protein Hcp